MLLFPRHGHAAPGTALGVSNLAITPDGKVAYAVLGSTVVPISTATNTTGTPIRVSGYRGYPGPGNIAISPDGRTAYTFTDNAGPGKQVVTPISVATNTPGKPITVTANSMSIVVAGDQVVRTSDEIVIGSAVTRRLRAQAGPRR